MAFSLLTDEEKAAVNRYFDKTDEPKITDGYDLFFKDFSKGGYVTSVSQLEKYFACPLQNYFAYGLRLQKRVTDVIENSLTGSFIHEVLEKYFTLFAEGKLDKKRLRRMKSEKSFPKFRTRFREKRTFWPSPCRENTKRDLQG